MVSEPNTCEKENSVLDDSSANLVQVFTVLVLWHMTSLDVLTSSASLMQSRTDEETGAEATRQIFRYTSDVSSTMTTRLHLV